MNGQDLLKGLSYVNDVFVEAAGAEKPRRKPWGKWLLTAACVCVLLVGSTLAAERLWGVSVVDMVTGKEESSYHLLTDLEPYPAGNFSSPQLTEALETIQQQYRDYRPWDSQIPSSYRTYLESWRDCEDFLGITVFNPLEDLDWLAPLSSSALPLTGDARHCELNLDADADGNLGYVTVQACYQAELCKISMTVDFAMEGGRFEPELWFIYDGEADFETDTFRLSDGQEAVLLTAQWSGARYSGVHAYFTRDGAIYTVFAWLPGTGQETVAMETLKTLLAYF